MFAICRRMLGDHHLAEDAFQAVFAVLARKAHTIRPPGAVGGWLHGVARKAALGAAAMRRRKYRESLPGILPEPLTDPADPDDTATLVDAEIARLPETLRAAVLLCEIEGVSRARAAERLGIAQGTLSSRLATARKILRVRLGRKGLAGLISGAVVVAVPEKLVKAAAGLARGQASGTVLELSNGVLRAMLLSKLKLAPTMALWAVLVAGAVLAAAAAPGGPTPAPPKPQGPAGAPAPPPLAERQPDWTELFTLNQGEVVTAVAASGEMVAVADTGCRLRLWSGRDGKELDLPVRGAKCATPADALRFSARDAYLVMSTPGGTAMRYERRAGGMVGDGVDGLSLLAWSADLNTLVARKAGQPNRLFLHGNVWAVPENLIKHSAVIDAADGVVITHVALSDDDRRLAVVGDDAVIRIYDRKSLEVLHTIKWKNDQKLTAVKLSGDGGRLAVSGEAGLAKVFDTATGAELCELKGHGGLVSAVAFTPDGKRVATAAGRVVRVFDAGSGKPGGEITGHGGDVTAVAFSSDGKRLVTGSADRTAKVWALAALAPRPPLADPEPKTLVARLGSRAFAEREAAARKLLALGFKALPAVTAGIKDSDPEVARRCEGLLAQIWTAQREAFVSGKVDWPGPGWARFHHIVGDTPAARALFAEMVDDPRRAGIADLAAAEPALAAKLYAAEVGRVQEAGTKAFANFAGQPAGPGTGNGIRAAHLKSVSPGDIVTVLFLGTFELPAGVVDPAQVHHVLRAAFIDLVTGPLKDSARKVYVAWLDRRRDPKALEVGLDAALFGAIHQAVPTARRVAADKEAPGSVVGSALMVLGTHGGLEELSRLSARRDDARAHSAFTTAGGLKYEIQVREVAAAMSLGLRGEDVAKRGLPRIDVMAWWVGPDPAPYKALSRIEKSEDRDAILRRAWEWLDEQPGAPKADPKPQPKK